MVCERSAVGENHRMSVRGHGPGVQTGRLELSNEPFGACLHIATMLRVGGYGWKREKAEQVSQKGVSLAVEHGNGGFGGNGLILSR